MAEQTFTLSVKSTADTSGLEAAIAKEKELGKARDEANAKGGSSGGVATPAADAFLAKVKAEQEAVQVAAQTTKTASIEAGASLDGLAGKLGLVGVAFAGLGAALKTAWGDNEKLRDSFSGLGTALSDIAKGALQEVIGKGEGLRGVLDGLTKALGGEDSAQRALNERLEHYVGVAERAKTAGEQLADAKAKEARASELAHTQDQGQKQTQDAYGDAEQIARQMEREQALDKIKQDAALSESQRRQKLAETNDEFDEQDANATKEKLQREADLTEADRQRTQEAATSASQRLANLQNEREMRKQLETAELALANAKQRTKSGEGLYDDEALAQERLDKLREKFAGKLTGPFDDKQQQEDIARAKQDAEASAQAQAIADQRAADAANVRDAKAVELDLKNQAAREKRDRENRDADAKDEQVKQDAATKAQEAADKQSEKDQEKAAKEAEREKQREDKKHEAAEEHAQREEVRNQREQQRAEDHERKADERAARETERQLKQLRQRGQAQQQEQEQEEQQERQKTLRETQAEQQKSLRLAAAQRDKDRRTGQHSGGGDGSTQSMGPGAAMPDDLGEALRQFKEATLQGHAHTGADLLATVGMLRNKEMQDRLKFRREQSILKGLLGKLYEPSVGNSTGYM